ncbi:unnamed protein product, partial [Anisakis simplex]|uniref:NUC domain-containing protein n=1 Tax=Anisakis simplex TaxID=6269 RepID=A0A158PNS1_ANISI
WYVSDLLKVPPAPNNGTEGHLYSVLRNPPSKVPELSSRLTSSQCTSPLKIANCNEYCQVKELPVPSKNPCVSYVEGISESKDCNENLGQNVTNLSLFINKAQYNTISDAFAKVRSRFANGLMIFPTAGTWGYLVDAIAGYVQKYGKIMVFSGPVYDSNYDGHRDSDEMILSSSPTHIFVILFRCASPHQQISPELCHNVTFIPFVLPIVDEDFNCLSHRDYLYENTARILDIELLTGLQFFTNRELWSPEDAILLRTRVTRGVCLLDRCSIEDLVELQTIDAENHFCDDDAIMEPYYQKRVYDPANANLPLQDQSEKSGPGAPNWRTLWHDKGPFFLIRKTKINLEDSTPKTKVIKSQMAGHSFVTFFIPLYLIVHLLHATDAHPVDDAQSCNLNECTRNRNLFSFKTPPLVIMSMDGFRASYLDQKLTPTLQRLMRCGVHSKYMIPSFPSKTFPNHYAIATGLYPGWNGIVDNGFYDANHPQKNFKKSSTADGWFLGEPIWNTVQKHGMKSAIFFWPGSEAASNGTKATVLIVVKVLEWLNKPDDQRPSLIQFYIEQPDHAGHEAGPTSELVKKGMKIADDALKYFVEKLVEEKLMGCINLIIVSDHGMQTIEPSRAVIMDKILPQPFTQALFTGALAHITMLNNDTTVDKLIAAMKCKKGESYLTYRTMLTPARYHYSGSKRIGDVVMIGRPGVLIFKDQKDANKKAKQFGNHGFDNRLESMRAIFVAIGPSIAEAKTIPEFQNVQLYNLFAGDFVSDLLKIPPAPNNGTQGHLYSVLRNPPSKVPEVDSTMTTSKCVSKLKIEMCNKACQKDSKEQHIPCKESKQTIPFVVTNGQECIVPLSDAVIHYNKRLHIAQLVETMITKEKWAKNTQFGLDALVILKVYRNRLRAMKTRPVMCRQYLCSSEEVVILGSMIITPYGYNTLDTAFVKVTSQFVKGTWQYLVDKINGYVQKYREMMMYSGPIYDSDGDAHRDSDEMILSSKPTHIFVILFRCASPGEQISPKLCHNVTFIPFVLPVVNEDFNCLKPDEYLYENTARILDIELLTGLKFFTDKKLWSPEEAILLRTRVTRDMW